MIIEREKEEMIASAGTEIPIDIAISQNIDDQRMILSVLSDTLYSDKISAVLREYGCNAADANVEAGCGDTPIEVCLPNNLNPVLVIRDFGFGMTREQVIGTYSQVGASTKRASNEVTGMLGIGSKAGYAYGDSFMVTSFHKGTQVIYNCYRENGMPKMSVMHSGPTEAADGVEIKVPVRQNDLAAFVTKAARVFKYFKVRPKFVGPQPNIVRPDPAWAGANWRFVGTGESVAVMGNVGYYIDPATVDFGSIHPKLKSLLEAGVELDFPIGALEVAADREKLQYKTRTNRALQDALEDVGAKLGDMFSQNIKAATSLWEAKKIFRKFFEERATAAIRVGRAYVPPNVKWRGQPITESRFQMHYAATAGTSATQIHKDSWSQRLRRSTAWEVTPHDSVLLVVNDLAHGSPSRERGAFNLPGISTVILFKFTDAAAEAKYLNETGLEGAPFVKLSSITPVLSTGSSVATHTPSAHRQKHQASVVVFKPGVTSDTRSQHWEAESVNLKKDKGVYVLIDNFFLKKTGQQPNALNQILKVLRAVPGLKVPDKVYGIKIAQQDKIGPRWEEFFDTMKARFEKLSMDSKFRKAWWDLQKLTHHETQISHEVIENKKLGFKRGSAAAKYLEGLRFMGRLNVPHEVAINFPHHGNILACLEVTPATAAARKLPELKKSFLDSVPIYKYFVDQYYYTAGKNVNEHNFELVKEYVRLLPIQPTSTI